jgi:aminopeptidase YwaD
MVRRRRARASAGALLVALALPAALALAAAPAVLSAPGQPAAAPDLLRTVSGERAYRHVLALSQKIGPHLAGTAEDKLAGEYIAAQLNADGYAVEWQAFPFPYFAVRQVSLAVPAESALVLHPHAMIYSPSSPAAGITAELVDAGIGRPEDFAGKAVAGKIALIARGTLPFRQKAMNAAAAGAAGAVIYNNNGGSFTGTLGEGVKIPVVSLSASEGLQLLDLVHAGPLTVRFNVQTVDERRTSWNIVGTKPGSDPRRVVVVGAHRDTVADAPGANDNTSGVATALEIAEVIRRTPLAATVRFVFFGAEELGLYGSEYYVKHMGAGHVVGMVNLDMEGVGERLELATYRGTDSLVQLSHRLAEQLGVKTQIVRSAGSDHQSFERIGVPVVFLFRPDDPYYDTPRDTVDRVDPKLLEISARLATAIVLTVAGAAPH